VDEEEAEFFPDAKDTLTETQEAKALKEFNDRKKKEVRKQEHAA
jgi:RNA polymerase-binding transcription factor DksA